MTTLLPIHGMTLAALAAAGFALSAYILYKKTNNQPLVCPLGHDCNKVIRSKYGTLFGIPNEVLGLLYYGFILLAGILVTAGLRSLFGISLFIPITVASVGAFAMSIVLTYIQVRILREYCTWCLASALVNTLIVGVELFAYLSGRV